VIYGNVLRTSLGGRHNLRMQDLEDVVAGKKACT